MRIVDCTEGIEHETTTIASKDIRIEDNQLEVIDVDYRDNYVTMIYRQVGLLRVSPTLASGIGLPSLGRSTSLISAFRVRSPVVPSRMRNVIGVQIHRL